MTKKEGLTVVCGTNRDGAASRVIAQHVVSLLTQSKKKVELLDLRNLKSEIFSATSYQKKPEWFIQEFQRPISEARCILFVVPEYNGSFPGALKFFIDMLEFPASLRGVPVACIGVAAGQFGALRAIEQLEMILHYRGAHLFSERLFIPRVTELVEPTLELGDLEGRLGNLLKNFDGFVTKLSS